MALAIGWRFHAKTAKTGRLPVAADGKMNGIVVRHRSLARAFEKAASMAKMKGSHWFRPLPHNEQPFT
jgi:hypothetical protein